MNDQATDRTIVGWDGSVEAQAALDWAVKRARRTGSGYHVVRVTGPFPFAESEALRAEGRRATAGYSA